MSRLVPISPKDLEKKLIILGFKPIPFHGNYEIGPVLLGKILKETKIKRDDFERL